MFFADAENVAKNIVGFLACQEMLLIRRLLVGIARGNHDAIGLQIIRQEIKKFVEFVRIFPIEDRRIGGDTKPFGFGGTNRADGRLEDAFPTDQRVVPFLKAVHMDAERQVG